MYFLDPKTMFWRLVEKLIQYISFDHNLGCQTFPIFPFSPNFRWNSQRVQALGFVLICSFPDAFYIIIFKVNIKNKFKKCLSLIPLLLLYKGDYCSCFISLQTAQFKQTTGLAIFKSKLTGKLVFAGMLTHRDGSYACDQPQVACPPRNGLYCYRKQKGRPTAGRIEPSAWTLLHPSWTFSDR